ncbi:hypothetical protein CWS_01090 [Buchnera aphidicola str. JF99 (Acyrthosiphon pisum)]|nr:hypothetical protein CWO_01060 [Buchnera aphidicola str. LL01 (Acyrthosiphon pisum)]ADP66604.1 hypothetical protein CWQ_01115 [Buchnera aphidicola str. TLW03 (Acyrthosiphon pisum)]ADP67183.1 hypothetical protein CWS_01090 [Buchnera aphidicola str. JF99 (Acyrthosiphon pisum)]OQX99826.1 MAG: hypothetical protein B6I27_00020 [Erwiniaceae bacterium 4572_131]
MYLQKLNKIFNVCINYNQILLKKRKDYRSLISIIFSFSKKNFLIKKNHYLFNLKFNTSVTVP